MHYFCPFPRAQREQIEKEKREQEKKAAGCLQHANELRRQVRENQQKHVQNRLATFEEGRRLKEEAQKRRERIEDIKKQKLEELRCVGFLSFLFSFPKRWHSRPETVGGLSAPGLPSEGDSGRRFWDFVSLAQWQLLGSVLGS